MSGTNNGLLKPHYQNRFKIKIIHDYDEKKFDMISRSVLSVTKPRIRNVRTTPIIEQIKLVLHDIQTNDVKRSIVELAKHFFTLVIETLIIDDNGQTTVAETWHLRDCTIEHIDFGSLNYASSDPVLITLTIDPCYEVATHSMN